MLIWLVRGMLVAIEVMTAYNLSDAWNADLVTGNAYRIALIVIAALAVFTFILSFMTGDEEEPVEEPVEETVEETVEVKQIRLTKEQAQEFMKMIESFKFEEDPGNENK